MLIKYNLSDEGLHLALASSKLNIKLGIKLPRRTGDRPY